MERFGRTSTLAFLILGLTVAAPVHARTPRGQLLSAGWQQVTRASWYGQEFRGQRTAAGTKFNPLRLTAAHRTLQLGSKVKVTDLRSGRWVVVQINDRGPYLRGRGIDLSYAAARELGILRRGVAQVRIELVIPEEASPPASEMMTAQSSPLASWLPRLAFD